MGAPATPVWLSSRTRVPLSKSVTQIAPKPATTPVGLAPTRIVWTGRPVALSTRVTVPSVVLATHSDPSAIAMPSGSPPTGAAAMTRPAASNRPTLSAWMTTGAGEAVADVAAAGVPAGLADATRAEAAIEDDATGDDATGDGAGTGAVPDEESSLKAIAATTTATRTTMAPLARGEPEATRQARWAGVSALPTARPAVSGVAPEYPATAKSRHGS